MKRYLRPAVHLLDATLADLSLRLGAERPALIGFIFHSLFADRREIESGLIDPFQPVTVTEFRDFIAFFLAEGYRFVRPAEVPDGLEPGGRYALITFDDGYANNLRALPVLRELGVPASFFVSSNHIARHRAFWWDVLYREQTRRGVPGARVHQDYPAWKRLHHREIETRLVAQFGDRALDPQGELDRPMSEAELKTFAADPLVTIGNHTADHAVLPLYQEAEIAAQIRTCQDYLTGLLGVAPEIIAYPNGDYDARAVRAARAAGLRLGLTCEARKEHLPIAAERLMTLGRFALDGGAGLRRQCRSCQSDLRLLRALRRLRRQAA